MRKAVWVSESVVVCNATRAPAGETRVEMTNNLREYTLNSVRVRFMSVRVLYLQPWSGPLGGATVVSLKAHGLWPGMLRCRFGDGAQ